MRYYTNGAGGNYNHHALLSDSTIESIIANATCADLYCSVQSYDNQGIETHSQLVFDIDDTNMSNAYDLAILIKSNVRHAYNTEASIWFSGSKGFHVITGLVGYSEFANVALKSIALSIADGIDTSMYKTRSLFRLPNSLNGKSGLRKIQVVDNESMGSIVARAESKQPFTPTPITQCNRFDSHFTSAVSNYLSNRRVVTQVVADVDWVESLPPCMVKLVDDMPEGYRWDICYWLVRHWRLCGVDIDDAINMAYEHPIFDEAKYTSGMIRHAYHGEVKGVGCLNGKLSVLMQMACNESCVHSEGWADRTIGHIIGDEDGYTRSANESVWKEDREG